MTINFTNKTIELTTAEMKKASVYNSDAYKALREARIDNPTFKIVEKKAAKSKDKFARLTMKDIAAHVEKYGSDNQKKNFEFLTNGPEEKASFFEVKKWFMNEFRLREVRAIKLTNKPFEIFIRNILFCVSVCFELSDLFHGVFLQHII